jgi:deoxycytidine triphosphate deaminase
VILSDRDLRRELEAGRIRVEPIEAGAVQPSSIDLRVGSQFRVFANSRYPYIDVRQPMEGLTELVEATEEEPFILHPGEFVLGSTFEKITLPDDLVARLEGKSSLGRLGLLIHSSLPGSEPVLLFSEGEMRALPIAEIVRKRLHGQVVSFDPQTLEVGYHQVTGWYEGPPDRIFEVVLASGRKIHVTAGHNLFTPNGDGQPRQVRTAELAPGTLVALPSLLPDPSVLWDRIDRVGDVGRWEPIFDLEVRPNGKKIENFVAGEGGVFVSNTAGFVDAGWSGNLTLELSNVANLPITIYPGMKIGQLCVFRMSSPAERPYGSAELASKYQGQQGPTPSRYFENFPSD